MPHGDWGVPQSPMHQQTWAKQENVCGVLRIELEKHQRYCVGPPHSAPHRDHRCSANDDRHRLPCFLQTGPGILTMTLTVNENNTRKPLKDANDGISKQNQQTMVRSNVEKEIIKQVVRQKLSKLRHLVVKEAISPEYLDSLFPTLLKLFQPQTVTVR